MKKVLLLAMVLVFALSFAFAQDGKITFLQDSGIVTVGAPVNVSFVIEEVAVDSDVTTIEVQGDEISDNVFVMLIKDAPTNKVYEATKVVNDAAKKTVYYIRAKELTGTTIKLHAELIDWNGKPVEGAVDTEVVWKEEMLTEVIPLTPALEGIYTVNAWIQLEGGETIKMESGQLVAMKKYIEQAVPGLTPYLANDAGNDEYVLKVKTGVEYMTNFTDSSTGNHLSIYGQGDKIAPDLYWSWDGRDMPTMDPKLEIVYDADLGSAYLKFKVMSEALEGAAQSGW